jgi:CarD family transcriptional regulator
MAQAPTNSFAIGEKVVYPNHGVGVIEQINRRSMSGKPEAFYHLKIAANNMMVMIPATNATDVGLRRLIKKAEVKKVLEHLKHTEVKNASDWKNRFKENSEKMRTGCIFEVADVLKSLSQLSINRILSFREKKMLDRARQLIVSELATVSDVSEDKAEQLIDGALLQT